jgi:hypothetical protein
VEKLLPDGSWLSTPRIGARHRRALGGQLPEGPHTVRLIDFTVIVTSPAGRIRREHFRLVTTLLDPHAWPAAELAALYVQRWCAETAIGLLKIDFLLDKNQLMRSKTPEGVDQELYAALVAYHLIRQLVQVSPPSMVWIPTGSATPARSPRPASTSSPAPTRTRPTSWPA